jgi:hypothetical protein
MTWFLVCSYAGVPGLGASGFFFFLPGCCCCCVADTTSSQWSKFWLLTSPSSTFATEPAGTSLSSPPHAERAKGRTTISAIAPSLGIQENLE